MDDMEREMRDNRTSYYLVICLHHRCRSLATCCQVSSVKTSNSQCIDTHSNRVIARSDSPATRGGKVNREVATLEPESLLNGFHRLYLRGRFEESVVILVLLWARYNQTSFEHCHADRIQIEKWQGKVEHERTLTESNHGNWSTKVLHH